MWQRGNSQNETKRVGGENWRLIMPTVVRKLALRERYSLLETYSLLLLFSLVTSESLSRLIREWRNQLICKAHSKTSQLIRLRNVRLPTEVCISKWELALSLSFSPSLCLLPLVLTSVFVFYRRNFRRFRKFMNFSRVSVRLRKLLYVKSWIGHWETLRSLRRNYLSGTAVVDWTFAKFDNYFYTSDA